MQSPKSNHEFHDDEVNGLQLSRHALVYNVETKLALSCFNFFFHISLTDTEKRCSMSCDFQKVKIVFHFAKEKL
ncbi:unnamed protein product [Amoebophrya sp. A25]|nr:unnamed protein product [Amoebophrya sp. A25]|eukprot:GSA25T00013039001.1